MSALFIQEGELVANKLPERGVGNRREAWTKTGSFVHCGCQQCVDKHGDEVPMED
jgi:hypothetical protein